DDIVGNHALFADAHLRLRLEAELFLRSFDFVFAERRLGGDLVLALLLEVSNEILALDPQLFGHLGNGLLRHLDYPSSPSARRRAVPARRMIPTRAATAGTACGTGI